MEVNDLRKNICLIKSEVYVKQEIKKKKKKKIIGADYMEVCFVIYFRVKSFVILIFLGKELTISFM